MAELDWTLYVEVATTRPHLHDQEQMAGECNAAYGTFNEGEIHDSRMNNMAHGRRTHCSRARPSTDKRS